MFNVIMGKGRVLKMLVRRIRYLLTTLAEQLVNDRLADEYASLSFPMKCI